MENKQTAIEELIELLKIDKKLKLIMPYLINVIEEVYIQKEKEQIKKAYETGCIGEIFELNCNESSESYYQKTYGKQ